MRLFSRIASSDQVIAEYLWGRHTVVLPPGSQLAGDLFPQVVASVLNDKLLARNDAEFREYVGVVHELTHCLQEVTTGLGMWDLLAREDMVSRVLEKARDASYGMDSQPSVEALGREYRGRSIVNTIGWGDDQEVPLLQRKLAGLVTGDVSHFKVVDLLEADATLSAYQTIRSMKAGVAQLEIRRRNQDVFSPHRSPHAKTYSDIAWSFAPETEEDPVKVQRVFEVLGPILMDLSFAVPPPAYLVSHGLDRDDFHPGVRLVRMLAALHRSGAGAEEMGDIVKDSRRLYSFMEEECRVTPHMTYPPVAEIYQAWFDTFTQLSARARHLRGTSAWLASLVEQRLNHEYPVWSRSPAIIVHLQIPFSMHAGTVKGLLQLFSFSASEEGKLLYLESKDRRLHEAISHYILGMQPAFCCPRAMREDGCPAQTEACFEGIKRLRELPTSNDCLAYKELDRIQFRFGGPPIKDPPPWL